MPRLDRDQPTLRAAFITLAGMLLAAVPAQAQFSPHGHTDPSQHVQALRDRFQQANSSHDGRLTLQQAQTGQLRNVARHFNDIDADHKGYITMDDVRAWHRRVAAQRHGSGQGGGAPGGGPDGGQPDGGQPGGGPPGPPPDAQ